MMKGASDLQRRHEDCMLSKQKARAEAIKAGHARRKAALYSKEVGKMKAHLSNGTMTSLIRP